MSTEDTEDTVIELRLDTLTEAIFVLRNSIRNLRNTIIFAFIIIGALYWKGVL